MCCWMQPAPKSQKGPMRWVQVVAVVVGSRWLQRLFPWSSMKRACRALPVEGAHRQAWLCSGAFRWVFVAWFLRPERFPVSLWAWWVPHSWFRFRSIEASVCAALPPKMPRSGSPFPTSTDRVSDVIVLGEADLFRVEWRGSAHLPTRLPVADREPLWVTVDWARGWAEKAAVWNAQ